MSGLKFPTDFKNYPIFTTKTNGKYELLSIVANHEIIEFLDKNDIDGLIMRLNELGGISYDLMNYASQAYSGDLWRVVRVIAEQFTKMFYEKYVDNSSMSGSSLRALAIDANVLFNALNYYIAILPDSTSYGKIQYNKEFLGNKFNKRLAVLFTSGIITFEKFYDYTDISAKELLNNAFGKNSSNEITRFSLKLSALKKAPEDLRDLYELMVQHKLGIVVEDSEIAEEWFDSLWIPASRMFQDPYTRRIPDISKSTNSDMKEVINTLKTRLDENQLAISMKYFLKMMEIVLTEDSAELWLKKSIEIFSSFFDGTIRDMPIVIGFLTNDNSREIASKVIERNISKYAHMGDIDQTDLRTYVSYPDPIRNRSIDTIVSFLKWAIDLHNNGDLTFTTWAFYTMAFSAAKNGTYILPYIDIRDIDVFQDILDASKHTYYTDYEKGYYQWLMDNNVAIRQIVINKFLNESFVEMNYTRLLSVEFVRSEYTSDELVENFKINIWPNIGPGMIFDELYKYKLNKKLMDGLLDFISNIPDTDMNYDRYQVLLLTMVPAKRFNSIISDIKAKNLDVAKEITRCTGFSILNNNRLFAELSANQELIENIDDDVFVELMKMAEIIGDPAAIFEFGRKVKNTDETKIDKAINGLKSRGTKTLFLEYLVGADIGLVASKEIFRDDVPIKPYEKLTEARIGEILKYNKITPTKQQLAKITSIKDINKLVTDFNKKIVDIKATPVEANEEYLERKTLEYDVFNKYRHGNIAPKIIREFNVNIKEQSDAFHAYVAQNSWVDIINPAFHGTGSVGASMILRYGFAVLNANDPNVTGRMLGNGVYFSTVIDKVSQYVADSGFSRGIGNKGFIFVMKAALGLKNKDYKSDGVDSNSYSLVSPEWVVFHPEKQLFIYKAFEVELVSKDDIIKLKTKYSVNESTAVEIKTFKEYIKESINVEYANATTFTFIDGTIPINKTNAIDFEHFDPKSFGDHVRLEGSQIGPMITIEHNGPQSQAFCVRNTAEFLEQPELVDFLTLLSGKVDI